MENHGTFCNLRSMNPALYSVSYWHAAILFTSSLIHLWTPEKYWHRNPRYNFWLLNPNFFYSPNKTVSLSWHLFHRVWRIAKLNLCIVFFIYLFIYFFILCFFFCLFLCVFFFFFVISTEQRICVVMSFLILLQHLFGPHG